MLTGKVESWYKNEKDKITRCVRIRGVSRIKDGSLQNIPKSLSFDIPSHLGCHLITSFSYLNVRIKDELHKEVLVVVEV